MSNELPLPIHPGEYIRDELGARGWTQSDLAEITGRTLKNLNQIISGKAGVSARTAKELSKAFGTSPDVWLNLQSSYDLACDEHKADEIAAVSYTHLTLPTKRIV